MGPVELDFTQHARDALEEREIPVEWVERVVTAPARTEPDPADSTLEHFLGRIAEHGNRVLRVVADPSTSPMLVITAFFDRRMRRLL